MHNGWIYSTELASSWPSGPNHECVCSRSVAFLEEKACLQNDGVCQLSPGAAKNLPLAVHQSQCSSLERANRLQMMANKSETAFELNLFNSLTKHFNEVDSSIFANVCNLLFVGWTLYGNYLGIERNFHLSELEKVGKCKMKSSPSSLASEGMYWRPNVGTHSLMLNSSLASHTAAISVPLNCQSYCKLG